MFKFPDVVEVGKGVEEFSQVAFVLSFPSILHTLVLAVCCRPDNPDTTDGRECQKWPENTKEASSPLS